MQIGEVSIIITAFREATTIGRAIESLQDSEITHFSEVIVICPDDETAEAASRFQDVRILRDPQQGKPTALQMAIDATVHDIIVMTDGDVYVGPNAVDYLVEPFIDDRIGAVSGRPVSISPRNTLLGFWSHLLTDAGAHEERMRLSQKGEFFVCSGYLYAVRKSLLEPIPADALAEDAVVSHMIGQKGYQIAYSKHAEVFVRYPETYSDWLKQKVRSAGGYAQPVIAKSPLRMRSFRHEVLYGTWRAIRYGRTLREFAYTLCLFGARLHLWLLILWRVIVKKTPMTRLWQRVDSTK